MSALKIFEHAQFGSVRIVMRGDDPWFVAKDVAESLGYRMASDMARHLDEDEKGTQLVRTPGGDQEMTAISEAGLYSAVLRSERPEAKAFRRWITHEVLPAIRRTGGYIHAAPDESPEVIMARGLLAAQETINKMKTRQAELENRITEDRPLVGFAKAVEASEDTILVKQLAGFMKQNGVDIGQNRLFEWLRGNGFLCRERGENWNKPTQKSMNLGLFEVKESIGLNPDGTTRIFLTSKVTGKGQHYFLRKFGVTDAEAKVQ